MHQKVFFSWRTTRPPLQRALHKKYFRVLDMKNVCMNYIDTTPQKLSFTFKLIKSKMNLEKK